MEKEKKERKLEEKVEQNTKHIWWLTIVMIILLIAVGLGGYLIGASRIANEVVKQKENVKNEEIIPIEFTISELTKYVNYIQPSSIGPSDIIYNVKSVKANNLSVAEKLSYIGHHIYAKQQTSESYNYSYLDENDVKSIMEEIYGPDTYKRGDFSLGCGTYQYNEREGRYAAKTGCGGLSSTTVKNEIIDYKATNSKLEITTAYAFYDSETKKIYKDYKKTIALTNYSGDNADDYLSNYVKENKNKLYHITYTFESKDEKNYYFKEFNNTI